MLKIIRAIISNFDDIIKMEDFDLNPIQDGGGGGGGAGGQKGHTQTVFPL